MKRAGFTLLELGVVVAIVTMGFVLLLPYLQKLRETANRLKCTDNLRRLANATHEYQIAHHRFPPGVEMRAEMAPSEYSDETRNFGPNWAVLLLPYVELGNIYEPVAASIAVYPSTGDDAWRSVRVLSVQYYLCPSDVGPAPPYRGLGGNWARGNYVANAGPALGPLGSGGALAATAAGQSPQSNCIWIPGSRTCQATFPYPGGGLMGVNFGVSLPELKEADGASSTILFNEVRIGPQDTDLRGTWALGQLGASLSGGSPANDCYGPNDRGATSDKIHNAVSRPDLGLGADASGFNEQASARSRHPGGVNTCFADGSVHFVNDNIDLVIWYCLQSRNDRQKVSY